MNCTLKNRPKPSDFATEDDCYDAQGYRNRTENWFKCFEKELHEEPPIVWINGVAYIKLKEILGDTPK